MATQSKLKTEREAFRRLTDLHDALVLAAEYTSDIDVLKFVHSSTEFAKASAFLRASQ